MDEKEYSVSEAVRLIGVESHVLRYWEEELQIAIRRTSQGHRVYSRENIDTFCQVKKLKEKGIQLKAIRVLLAEREYVQTGEAERLIQTGEAQQNAGESRKKEDTEQVTAESKKEELDIQETMLIRKLLEFDQSRPKTKEKQENSRGKTEGSGRYDNSEEAMHAGGQNEADESADTYEVLPLVEKPDNLRQFELILKRMMEEVVAEQNEKLERAISEMIRGEIEELYLQYYHMTQEAAAASMSKSKKKGIAGLIKRLRGS